MSNFLEFKHTDELGTIRMVSVNMNNVNSIIRKVEDERIIFCFENGNNEVFDFDNSEEYNRCAYLITSFE